MLYQFVEKKENTFFLVIETQSLIGVILVFMRQNVCYIIQTEEVYVDIMEAAVTMSFTRSTTLIVNNTDILLLLLYNFNWNSKALLFWSDKRNLCVYVIIVFTA